MNSVYYIFLVIVILSFNTGLTITYIDNKKAESLEKEKKLAANKPVVESAAPSFVAQSNSFVPYAEPVYDNVVPYIPVEQNYVQQTYVQPQVIAQPVIPQEVQYNQYNVITPPPVIEPQAPVQIPQPTLIPVVDLNPAIVNQHLLKPMESVAMDNKIQIENPTTSDNEYFNVPVMMSMDDDRL